MKPQPQPSQPKVNQGEDSFIYNVVESHCVKAEVRDKLHIHRACKQGLIQHQPSLPTPPGPSLCLLLFSVSVHSLPLKTDLAYVIRLKAVGTSGSFSPICRPSPDRSFICYVFTEPLSCTRPVNKMDKSLASFW